MPRFGVAFLYGDMALHFSHFLYYSTDGWCLEAMDFVDFLLCCIQNTQNLVARALVLNGPEYYVHYVCLWLNSLIAITFANMF